MAQPVVIQWSVSSFFGWGVYGLNLALQWAHDPDIEPVCATPFDASKIALDPLRERAILPFLVRSEQFQAKLKAHADGRVTADAPVLMALGNGFLRTAAAHNVRIDGNPTIGVVFFEYGLNPIEVDLAKAFDLIITGSTWNERVLRAHGIERVRTIFQGVDPARFHPMPKAGVLGDRFAIFSGGKAELRKGQDIVLAAFKRFSEKHPEAVLVTAWHSPWPALASSLDQTGIAKPVVLKDGKLDVYGWAESNGISPYRVIDLGDVPNTAMPAILAEMDAAVFPNRCEGGTNLVAMECMACGIPTVLSRNTGHLDLIIGGSNCYPLDDQREPPGFIGWGESQADEVVERLEQIFINRERAKLAGLCAAKIMQGMTWADTARQMKEMVLGAVIPALPAAIARPAPEQRQEHCRDAESARCIR